MLHIPDPSPPPPPTPRQWPTPLLIQRLERSVKPQQVGIGLLTNGYIAPPPRGSDPVLFSSWRGLERSVKPQQVGIGLLTNGYTPPGSDPLLFSWRGWKDLLNLNRWASDYLPMGTSPLLPLVAVTQSSSPHIGVRKICLTAKGGHQLPSLRAVTLPFFTYSFKRVVWRIHNATLGGYWITLSHLPPPPSWAVAVTQSSSPYLGEWNIWEASNDGQ